MFKSAFTLSWMHKPDSPVESNQTAPNCSLDSISSLNFSDFVKNQDPESIPSENSDKMMKNIKES